MRSLRASSIALAAVFCAATAFAGQHGHSAPPHGAPAATPHASAPHATTTHDSSASTTTSGATTAPGSTASSPIASKIESHPQLASKVNAMLPPGTTLQQAASGFRNQGQFIAALHVSRNVGIPFADLKAQMVTGNLSLGQAIQKLRPEANSTRATRQAESETDIDLKTPTTGSTPGATAGATTTTGKNGKNHR